MNNTILKLSLPLALLITAPVAHADNSFYVAASGLNADYEGGFDESGYSVAIGKYVGERVSLEVGYANFGDASATSGGISAAFDAEAVQFSAVGYLPVSKDAGLFGRVGVERIKTDASLNQLSGSVTETNPFVGVGAYMNVTENLDVRLEYQRHEFLDTDLNTVSAGLTLKTF